MPAILTQRARFGPAPLGRRTRGRRSPDCWAHLLRKFISFAQRNGPAGEVGERLRFFTELIFTAWHRVRDGTMSRSQFRRTMRPVPLARTCATMALASCPEVRRKVAMGGGTQAATARMVTSSMTPGPLSMAETRPMASAPAATATLASSVLLMQQILILGRAMASIAGIVP
jgi:hypothetical protein